MADLVTEWLNAVAMRRQWEEYENNLRKQVIATYFPAAGDGTHRFDFGNGYKLKLVNTTALKLDYEEAAKIVPVIRESEHSGLIPKLFKWTPTLVKREYDVAPSAVRDLLVPAVTSKPSMPQLELEIPK